MNEYLLKFENACLESSPEVLLIIGLVFTITGLFLWLGGTRYSWIVAGMAGAAGGFGLGLVISATFETPTLPTLAISIIACAGLAILLQNLIIILLAVAIFAAGGGTASLSYVLSEGPEPQDTQENRLENITETDKAIEIAGKIEGKLEEFQDKGGLEGFSQRLRDITDEVKEEAAQNKGILILFTAIGALLGLFLALMVLKWVVLGLCCSIVGSATLIIGIMMLLMLKEEIRPVTYLINDPKLLPSIFFFMVIFGWAIEMLLAGPLRQKEFARKHKNQNEDK